MATIRKKDSPLGLLHRVRIEYLLVNLGIIRLDECEY